MENPLWKREINIAKIRIEMMLMDLQMEYQNGAGVYRKEKPSQQQPIQPSPEQMPMMPPSGAKIEQTPATPQ